MKRFTQILHGRAHWIFEAEEKPKFAPDIVLIDITGKSEVQEGWDYDSETGLFTEPVQPEPIEEEPAIEKQILFETQYQTLLLEIMNSGGMI